MTDLFKCLHGCPDSAHCRDSDNCPFRIAGAEQPPVPPKRDDGGAAFPFDEYASGYTKGMSLRDYFAARAMQAFLQCTASSVEEQLSEIARAAYAMADAMLEARKR
jgi:hypothetical protein